MCTTHWNLSGSHLLWLWLFSDNSGRMGHTRCGSPMNQKGISLPEHFWCLLAMHRKASMRPENSGHVSQYRHTYYMSLDHRVLASTWLMAAASGTYEEFSNRVSKVHCSGFNSTKQSDNYGLYPGNVHNHIRVVGLACVLQLRCRGTELNHILPSNH